jgi:hypothetical protein
MAADLKSPFPKCINYLKLASEKGLGEYDLTKIEIIDSVITGVEDEIPALVQLDQNFPNPFKTSTTIRYTLPDNSDVQLIVYTLSGQRVAELINQKMNAGTHEVIWNAGDFANGIYIISLKTKSGFITKKMTLSK